MGPEGGGFCRYEWPERVLIVTELCSRDREPIVYDCRDHQE